MAPGDMGDAVCVTMEILSTWGSVSRVGLTEVEFFDVSNTKLYVSPHDVAVRSSGSPGELGSLVNRNLAVSGRHRGRRLAVGLGFPLPS